MEDTQRLSALDASFLGLETEEAPMHVGAVMRFEGPCPEQLRTWVERVVERTPRYRQRLGRVPGIGHPVWLDDDAFDIDYHLQWLRLDGGCTPEIEDLAKRVYEPVLDRSRPLWQFFVVEGLADGGFALIAKVHHCLIDGMAGAAFLTALLRGTPDDRLPAPSEWHPSHPPGPMKLLTDELRYRFEGWRHAAAACVDTARKDPAEWWRITRDAAVGLGHTLIDGLKPAVSTPLNPTTITPNRMFAGLRIPLQDIKHVKRTLGGTVNDVVLATVCGALARYFDRRDEPAGEASDFRAMVPVNLRRQGDARLGNQVAMMLARLPISERDPRRRLAQVSEVTEALKHQSAQVASAQLLEAFADFARPKLVQDMVGFAVRRRAYNVVCTNVPGPPFELYLLGAKLREIYPLVPLFGNQGVGFALLSYAGTMHWGVNADITTVPDARDLVGDLCASFDELLDATSSS